MEEHFNKLISYFAGFGSKNLSQISENFSDDVSLKDWTGSWSGKEKTEEAISSILLLDIYIVPREIRMSHQTAGIVATCVIDIYVDRERTEAVDIIKMTNEGEIKSINAYKR